MAHAERCPVCRGEGTIVQPPNPESTTAAGRVRCHGCDGKGWVQVQDASHVPWPGPKRVPPGPLRGERTSNYRSPA